MFTRKKLAVDNNVATAVHLTVKQSLVPNISGEFFRWPKGLEGIILLTMSLVTALFFLWGFAYGLLDVLNSHFQSLLHLSGSQASGLTAAYFGAYFLCPLTLSGWILRRFGYRVTFVTGMLLDGSIRSTSDDLTDSILGLAILAVGCLFFWPSGVKKSFGGFCGSMFIVGAGL